MGAALPDDRGATGPLGNGPFAEGAEGRGTGMMATLVLNAAPANDDLQRLVDEARVGMGVRECALDEVSGW